MSDRNDHTSQCPDLRTLLQVTTGELAEPEAGRVRAHIARCSACTVLTSDRDALIDAYVEQQARWSDKP